MKVRRSVPIITNGVLPDRFTRHLRHTRVLNRQNTLNMTRQRPTRTILARGRHFRRNRNSRRQQQTRLPRRTTTRALSVQIFNNNNRRLTALHPNASHLNRQRATMERTVQRQSTFHNVRARHHRTLGSILQFNHAITSLGQGLHTMRTVGRTTRNFSQITSSQGTIRQTQTIRTLRHTLMVTGTHMTIRNSNTSNHTKRNNGPLRPHTRLHRYTRARTQLRRRLITNTNTLSRLLGVTTLRDARTFDIPGPIQPRFHQSPNRGN